jgi:hypothetical protein
LRPTYTYVYASEVRLSPILVRPVREQLEHDRVIRLLQAKYKRKFDVAINPGATQAAPVGNVTSPWYPDLVLQSNERGRKLLGVVEVETAESVNHLEAMSQWAAFSRLRAPFHLYVPSSNIDAARRLCADLRISVAEIWAYSPLGDQMRFTLIQKSGTQPDRKAGASAAASQTGGRTRAASRAASPAKPASRSASPASRRKASVPARATSKAAPRRAAARKAPSRAQKRK